MEIIALCFLAGWALSHAFSEKRDEYAASQEAHREKYLAKLNRDHPSWGRARRERYLHNAARRNALGHIAYLVRHGWSSTFNDVGDGWNRAKAAHEEWKKDHPKGEKKAGWWATFKAGWKQRWSKRTKNTVPKNTETPVPKSEPPKPVPPPQPKEDTADPEPKPRANPWLTDDEARDAEIIPWPNGKSAPPPQTPGDQAGSTNGAPVTPIATGEAHSIDDVRRNSSAFVNTLKQVNGAADQLLADVLRFASKDAETRARIARGIEALNTAIAEFGGMPASLSKHIAGEEYAQSGHAVDRIDALHTS